MGWVAVFESCNKHLTSLICTKLHSVSDMTLLSLARNCPRLREFEFSNFKIKSPCWDVTDVGVIAIAKRCVKLTSVKLSYIRKLTLASLKALEHHCCKDLKTLECVPAVGDRTKQLTGYVEELRKRSELW